MSSFTHIANILLATFLLCACCSNHGRVHVSNQPDGIDVSHHQGVIDWKKVKEKAPSLQFVYIKLSEGATYTDPRGIKNAEGAKKNGFLIGGYHYFRLTSGVREQFEHFSCLLDRINPDLVPMVDVERSDGKARSELQDSLSLFLALLEKRYHKAPMIYGTNASYNGYCAPAFNDYPLYLGRYGRERPIITGEGHYTIWQYSESGVIEGIEKQVDFCRFHPDCGIADIRLPGK